MAVYEGTLPAVVTYTERVTQIKDLIDLYLSAIFIFDSDTGTGDSRALAYKMPGNSIRLLRTGKSSTNFFIGLRNLANTANAQGSAEPFASAIAYTIIINSGSGCLRLGTLRIWWGIIEGETVSSFNNTIYPKTGSDVQLTTPATTSPVSSFPFVNGNQVFAPVFLVSDTNNTLYNGAVTDIYRFTDVGSFAVGVKFTVGANTYMSLGSSFCIKA
jgi:hypothetical protein